MNDFKPLVEIDHLSFRYQSNGTSQVILEDVSLNVEPLDFIGIIGPNGGGKTTLLKIILGLLKPQSGTITVFGRAPVQVRSTIGYVPQYSRIDPSVPANVLDVVLMGRLGRTSWGARYSSWHIEAAMNALQQTETQDLAAHSFRTLSGGQRQRILIARALAADAKLILLDEPTASVDPEAKHDLIYLLHRLNQSLPIILVSHDISFVSTHLKRVACLNRRMTCHHAHEINDEVIANMYHGHVQPVHHPDDCTLANPGCEQDHKSP